MDEGVKGPGEAELLKPETNVPSGKGGRRSRRLLRLTLAGVFATGFIAWLWWESAHRAPPQIITLPNGERYQFAGVTYGTNNVPPYFPARLVRWLPKRLSDMVRKYAGPRISQWNERAIYEKPQIFVWFRRLGTNPPAVGAFLSLSTKARLADSAGVEAGVNSYPAFASNVPWSYAEFSVVPRRSRVLQCNIYPFGGNGDPFAPIATVTFPNPVYGRFPQWQPEALPTVKPAGDVEARFDEITTGHRVGGETIVKANGSRGSPQESARRGEDSDTEFDVSLNSSRGTNEAWVPASAELSDATGNVIRAATLFSVFGPESGIYLHPKPSGQTAFTESLLGTFWPDETAWRLKLEIKRAYGFAPEELATFKNVSIPAIGTTNFPRLTNIVGGIPVVLTEFVRKPDITINAMGLYGMTSEVHVELPGKPAGVALDSWSMSADSGTAVQYGSSGLPPFVYVLLLKSIPANAQTMTFTFVVQKTRSVEFMVKPPKSN